MLLFVAIFQLRTKVFLYSGGARPNTALNNYYGADVLANKRIAQKIFTDAPSNNTIKNLDRKIK
jgi:hypothetical protein